MGSLYNSYCNGALPPGTWYVALRGFAGCDAFGNAPFSAAFTTGPNPSFERSGTPSGTEDKDGVKKGDRNGGPFKSAKKMFSLLDVFVPPILPEDSSDESDEPSCFNIRDDVGAIFGVFAVLLVLVGIALVVYLTMTNKQMYVPHSSAPPPQFLDAHPEKGVPRDP